jgi:glycerate 2-kinase
MPGEEQLLKSLFDAAVDACQPARLIPDNLPSPPSGRTIVVGAGKAAAGMAQAVEKDWSSELSGLVIVPYGHALDTRRIEVIEAGHPVPDDAGHRAAKRLLEKVQDLASDDLVICLLSGGGSALMSVPCESLSLAGKQSITVALLKSGANIAEINCVRKHLSAIKGGRLAAACSPARIVTLAISDVSGNDASVIASGPTVPDPTTSEMAIDILRRHNIDLPEGLITETPKAADPVFETSEYKILATAHDAMQTAAALARDRGTEALILGDLEGDATVLAREHASLAQEIAAGRGPVKPPCIVISGGETTVRVHGSGSGGRNSEYGLALAIALAGHTGIFAIACDTDGIDGTGDNAGCIITPDSLSRAQYSSLNAESLLRNNDSYRFFFELGDLVVTGPTRTNVNDFRAILIRDQ